MIYYITLGTNDLPKAKTFYQAVMPCLGLFLRVDRDDEIAYGKPEPEPARFFVVQPFDGKPATVANGSMPAFYAPSHSAVDAFHKAGLASGGTDEGAPGLRPYGKHFYSCYLRDPDGNKISAVCEGPGRAQG
jgi:catechol 2,3-dioxygenase-like lactoylglutathione lyase family enzyme